MRRVALLARHVRIRVRLQDRVDDAGEPVQLRPPAPASSGGSPAAPNSSASSSPSGGRSRTAARPRDGSDPPRQPPDEPPHRAPRRTSPTSCQNRQEANSGAILRRRDRTARSLRVGHYSSAVNTDHHLPQKHGTRSREGRTPPPPMTSRGSLGQGERSLTSQFEIAYGLCNPLGFVSVSAGNLRSLRPDKLDKAIGTCPGSRGTCSRFIRRLIACRPVVTGHPVLLPQSSSSPNFREAIPATRELT